MNRSSLRSTLENLDLSERSDEVPFREKMIALLDSSERCFLRSTFPAHFTGSVMLVSSDGLQTLLHHHRKLDKWLPFGGHCDGEENVLAVAQREALEESGIEGLILASPRPFDLDVHTIPARQGEPEHEHFDVRWMLIAPENATFKTSPESIELRWFTPDQMEALPLTPGNKRLLAKWRRILTRRAHSAS